MRRDKRVTVVDLPVEDPERIAYTVPAKKVEEETAIPVYFPQREYVTTEPKRKEV